jgi:DNA-binding MarR family transcriptional regulator
VPEVVVDPLEEDLEALTALLPRLMGAFQRSFARDLAGFGLTFPQFVTLNALEQFEGKCRMGPLATAALQSAASMTGIVDRLLEQGYVVRERHPEDRRSVVVLLTDKGSRVLAEVKENRRQQGRFLMAAMPAEDRRRIRAVLTRMVDLVEKSEEDE